MKMQKTHRRAAVRQTILEHAKNGLVRNIATILSFESAVRLPAHIKLTDADLRELRSKLKRESLQNTSSVLTLSLKRDDSFIQHLLLKPLVLHEVDSSYPDWVAVMGLEETNLEKHYSILSGPLKIIEGYMQHNGHYVSITGGKHDELIDSMRVNHEEELADLLSKHEDECLNFTKRLEKSVIQLRVAQRARAVGQRKVKDLQDTVAWFCHALAHFEPQVKKLPYRLKHSEDRAATQQAVADHNFQQINPLALKYLACQKLEACNASQFGRIKKLQEEESSLKNKVIDLEQENNF
ncbi:hypothetical protein SLS56_003613 [Neofusicoccum ribis]|uniref:Uncharacterized protein n=1 Tax=Neofusicoccum ribis TaxID=45134 RepID=A0ABR3SYW8_9PEZI